MKYMQIFVIAYHHKLICIDYQYLTGKSAKLKYSKFST